MLLTEYDEAFHIASEKEISLSEGIQIGEKRGMSRGIEIGRSEGIEIGKAEEKKRTDIYKLKTDIYKLKLKGYDEATIAMELELPIEQVRAVLEEV